MRKWQIQLIIGRNSRNIYCGSCPGISDHEQNRYSIRKRTNYHKYFQNLFVPKSGDFKPEQIHGKQESLFKL